MTYEWKPAASSTDTPTGGPAVRVPPVPLAATIPSAADEAPTVADVVEEFVAAADKGRTRNRNGRKYRPSALRDLAGCLRNYVVPDLGDLRLRDVQPEDLQRLVDELAAGDLSLSRIRSVVSAIRGLYVYAIERGIIEVSAADGLDIARVEQPLWDEPAYGDTSARHRTAGWGGAAEEPWMDGPFMRRGAHRREARDEARDVGDRPLPELVLSLVLRLVVTVFIIIALMALAQALLLPA